MTSVSLGFLDYGAAGRAYPGQQESGDAYLVEPYENGALIAVIDGLGHGVDAALAARTAVAALKSAPRSDPAALVNRCHAELRHTNGVVMSLACVDVSGNTLSWLGVGNVEALLVRGAARRESLLLRGGVVGYQLPPLRAASLPVASGDWLVFATDGIAGSFTEGLSITEDPQQLTEAILTRYGKSNDDALVLAARYRGGGR